MERKLSSLLSLCTKAGMLTTGEETAERLLKNGKAQLIIVAADAALNTQNKFTNKCFFYQKPVRVFGEKAVLNNCVGKRNRTVFIITDAGFASRILTLIDMQIREVTECPKPVFMN